MMMCEMVNVYSNLYSDEISFVGRVLVVMLK